MINISLLNDEELQNKYNSSRENFMVRSQEYSIASYEVKGILGLEMYNLNLLMDEIKTTANSKGVRLI